MHATQSLCPVCLRRLEAAYEEDGVGAVYLTRTCPQHGRFSALVWPARDAVPSLCSFDQWHVVKTPSYPERPQTGTDKGCPYDCGLCPSHAQHTCHGLLELTLACNLACPLCYADAGGSMPPPDPPRETVSRQLKCLLEASGRCNVQFSGGEPTLREDLPDLVREAKALGFPLVQVNTNGVLLGRDPELAQRLAEAGLDSVYLQWDSLEPERLAMLRGTRVPNLLELKERA
ncbi:MAG: radical SAM protein, partial [Desulfovibrio sp.]|nr:radical SAM protein [Desulfovibrio sp.]